MTTKAFNDVIRSGDFLVLDTETTGLDRSAEICQIAIINSAGDVLLDALVKPVNPIPLAATAIHGISNAMVQNAPGWAEVSAQVINLISGKHVVIYNAVYDRKLMHQSAEQCGMAKTDWKTIANFYCAMERFAVIYGEWNDWHKSYKWQTLRTAAQHYKLPDNDAHTALGDCLTTLAVCRAMVLADTGK